MKEKIRWAVILILYLIGVGIFAIPDLNNLANKIENIRVYETFQKNVEDASGESGNVDSGTDSKNGGAEDESDSAATETDKDRFVWLYEQMTEYNQQIFAEKQKNLCDPWSYEQSSFDLTEYGIEDNVAATIEIPRMDVELPVYLGATTENMALGAVQLGQTSLPVGGENTNCVIAAHRGYRGIPMFREIEKLQLGDKVVIRNFWETLIYEVSEIAIIYPSDIDEILIRPGEDMVTLLTCHPYTQHTRRYVVFCTRVSDEEDRQKDSLDCTTSEFSIKAAEQAGKEDADILQREKLLRIAGYGFLAIVGIAIVGTMIWSGVRNRVPVKNERAGRGHQPSGHRRKSKRHRKKW